MKIENNGYNISINFIGRVKDVSNIWKKLKNDANIIAIFLVFSVEECCGATADICIPLKDIDAVYKGLSSVLENNSFTYSCNLPFNDSDEESFTISAEQTSNGIHFFLRIYDNFCGYIELTEVMNTSKFNNILLELKDVLDEFPII